MNIYSNGGQKQINEQNGAMNVMGNGNLIRINNSRLQVTVNGNSNQFQLNNSLVQFNVNGNANTFIVSINCKASFGFNGSNNSVQSEIRNSDIVYTYMNGINNITHTQNDQRSRINQQNGRQRFRNQRYQNNQNGNNINNQQQLINNSNRRRQNMPFDNRRQRNNNNGSRQRNIPQVFYEQPNRSNNHEWQRSNQSRGPSWPYQRYFNFNQQENNQEGLNFGQQIRTQIFNNPNFQMMFQFQQIIHPRRPRVYNFEMQNELEQQRMLGLTQEEINMLPSSKHIGKQGKCSICLCEIEIDEEETYLMCIHSFHSKCIFDWLAKNSKCPVCQNDIAQYLRK